MRKPYIIVVIPFKGQIELLREAVFSFLRSYTSGLTYSIICWDDGSTDDELNILYNSIPHQVIISKHNNVGYTQTVHNIVNYVKGDNRIDFLLLCNSDIKMRPGSFYALVNRILKNENYGAVGGKILKYGTDEIQHTGTIVKNNKIEDPYCGLNCNDPKTNFVERRMWANGSCVLYNLNVLRKLNLNFDIENFSPAYFEEADLMANMNLLGYPILYEPKAEIEHMVNATMGKERNKYEQIFWKNWETYKKKWEPLYDKPQFKFCD